jgi:hypothetical protein
MCALHCASHEDQAELSSKDADRLFEWLRNGDAGTFTPRSSSRLFIDATGNGGLVVRMAPWPAQ